MPRSLLRFALPLILLSLGGCLPSKILLVPDAGELTELPAQKGVVAVRVIDLGNGIPLQFVTFAPLDLNEVDENQFKRLRAYSMSKRRTGVFVSAVEAGEYSLSDLYGVISAGDYIFSRRIDATPAFGTFSVQPGQLTNLGTILYYPAPNEDTYTDRLVRNEAFPGLETLIEEDFSALESSLGSRSVPLGWHEDDSAGDRLSTYLSAIQNPLVFDASAVFEDETIIISRVGGMLRQDMNGDWTFDGVETDAALVAIDKNANGDHIVTSEDGEVFLRRAHESDWQPVQVPDTEGKVVAVSFGDQQTQYAFVAGQHTIAQFKGNDGLAPDWRLEHIYRQDRGWQPFDPNDDARKIVLEYKPDGGAKKLPYDELDGVSFANAGRQFLLSTLERVYVFDKSTGAVKELDTRFKTLAVVTNGRTVVAKGGLNWASDPVSHWAESPDGPWTKVSNRIDRCPGERHEARTDRCLDGRTRKFTHGRHGGEPYLAPNGRLYSIMTVADKPTFLASSRPTSKHWVQVDTADEFPEYCNRILPSRQDNTLLIGCSGTTGRIYEYDIAEGTYRLVREPAAF